MKLSSSCNITSKGLKLEFYNIPNCKVSYVNMLLRDPTKSLQAFKQHIIMKSLTESKKRASSAHKEKYAWLHNNDPI